MVSSMAVMALGFAGFSAGLALNFYRKYQARLEVGERTLAYARVADYKGVPLRLAFTYLSEDGNGWHPVEVDVDEIYHYGPDYFLHGFGIADRKGQVFKWNRIGNLRVRSDGRSVASMGALLDEVMGRDARPVNS